MQHADFLSRNPPLSTANVSHIRNPSSWAKIAQTADVETQELISRLRDGQLDDTRYVIKNDLLYYKFTPTGEDPRLLCYIPKGHRLSLLRVFHDEHDHIGTDRTTDLILRHFWFPSLRQFVKKYISYCLVCLAHKKVPRAPSQPIQSWTKPDIPFSIIHTDVLGPLQESNGFKYVLIIVDAFSKYCLLYSLYRQNTDELKRVFSNAVSLFGTPSTIVCDRARMFESATFQNWVSDLGCSVGNKGSQWSDVLWRMQLTLNISKQSTTQTSPLQLLVGIDAVTPVIRSLVRDVALTNSNPNREALLTLRRQRASELLATNQQRQDAYVNEGRRQPLTFAVGDFVFVSKTAQITGKLDSGMRGPYKVIRALPCHRYELELLAGSYGKKTQAAAENMMLWQGEWTPDACSVFFETETALDNNEQVARDETNEERNGSDASGASNAAVEDAALSGTAVL
ncbi:uncharacterized protein LOC125049782 isoform X2 [Pieris napi]|uniref:uncharacterized protein LOC125049782 isoform X2 n=1 Tax=Pieris napi TaxID=78633 RepID=UPI001FBA2ACB|nr:uncharacterized protein LOC125049782 isoform X2 [Pieris napi]